MTPARAARPRAKRSLGQNFLVDPNLQRKIAAAVGAGPGDRVLEIGPGTGALTDHLAAAGARIVAVELDDVLAERLKLHYKCRPCVTIVHGDVLKEDLPALAGDWGRTRVVGNIPYNITTPILFRLLRPPCPADIVLTVQAEVADRIMAAPGSRAYGALSVGVAVHARAARVCRVPRRAFRPAPRVESVAVRITPFAPPRFTEAEAARIRDLTRAAFSWRRKQLGTILRRHPDLRHDADRVSAALDSQALSPTVRPERLSVSDLARLAAALNGGGEAEAGGR